jgi:ABC-type dipeptide/oligopeptide/nickel transport system permease subunit
MQQLGEVTSGITFFRSIGSTIGIAVLGTVMTNQFHSALASNMPAALKHAVPPSRLAALQNPQVLLAPGTAARIQHAFAADGSQGALLFGQLMHAIRVSLASAIAELFLVGAGALALALLATFFLREIPLRKANRPREAVGVAPEPAAGPQRTEALVGLTLDR